MAARFFTLASDVTTGDAYANLGSPFLKPNILNLSIGIENSGVTNSVTYKILGSLDLGATYPYQLATGNIGASSSIVFSSGSYVNALKVQVKSAVTHFPSTVTGQFAGI